MIKTSKRNSSLGLNRLLNQQGKRRQETYTTKNYLDSKKPKITQIWCKLTKSNINQN